MNRFIIMCLVCVCFSNFCNTAAFGGLEFSRIIQNFDFDNHEHDGQQIHPQEEHEPIPEQEILQQENIYQVVEKVIEDNDEDGIIRICLDKKDDSEFIKNVLKICINKDIENNINMKNNINNAEIFIYFFMNKKYKCVAKRIFVDYHNELAKSINQIIKNAIITNDSDTFWYIFKNCNVMDMGCDIKIYYDTAIVSGKNKFAEYFSNAAKSKLRELLISNFNENIDSYILEILHLIEKCIDTGILAKELKSELKKSKLSIDNILSYSVYYYMDIICDYLLEQYAKKCFKELDINNAFCNAIFKNKQYAAWGLLKKCIELNLTKNLNIESVFGKAIEKSRDDVIKFLSKYTPNGVVGPNIENFEQPGVKLYEFKLYEKKLQKLGMYRSLEIKDMVLFFVKNNDADSLRRFFCDYHCCDAELAYEILKYIRETNGFRTEIHEIMCKHAHCYSCEYNLYLIESEEEELHYYEIYHIADDITDDIIDRFHHVNEKLIGEKEVGEKEVAYVKYAADYVEYLVDYIFSINTLNFISTIQFDKIILSVCEESCKEKGRRFELFEYVLKKCCENENLLKNLGVCEALRKFIIENINKEDISLYRNLIEACNGNIVLLQEISANSKELEEAMKHNIYKKEAIELAREQLKQIKLKSEHTKSNEELYEIFNTNIVKFFEINGGFISSITCNPFITDMLYQNQQTQSMTDSHPTNAIVLSSDKKIKSKINSNNAFTEPKNIFGKKFTELANIFLDSIEFNVKLGTASDEAWKILLLEYINNQKQ